MDKLEQLWKMAEDMNVFVDFAPLAQRCPKLFGLYIAAGPAILLDEALRHLRREQKCVLAEEIGHHLTGARTDIRYVYKSYKKYGECNETIIMAQDERNALRWACDHLMPDVELCRAVKKGVRSCYEIAEYFEVTEWLVYRKLGFLKVCFRRQGLKVKGRELFNVAMVPYQYLSDASPEGMVSEKCEAYNTSSI